MHRRQFLGTFPFAVGGAVTLRHGLWMPTSAVAPTPLPVTFPATVARGSDLKVTVGTVGKIGLASDFLMASTIATVAGGSISLGKVNGPGIYMVDLVALDNASHETDTRRSCLVAIGGTGNTLTVDSILADPRTPSGTAPKANVPTARKVGGFLQRANLLQAVTDTLTDGSFIVQDLIGTTTICLMTLPVGAVAVCGYQVGASALTFATEVTKRCADTLQTNGDITSTEATAVKAIASAPTLVLSMRSFFKAKAAATTLKRTLEAAAGTLGVASVATENLNVQLSIGGSTKLADEVLIAIEVLEKKH